MERNIIDVANQGALMDKTSVPAKYLISNITKNSQHFNTRSSSRSVHELNIDQTTTAETQRLENRIIEITSLLRQLAQGQKVNMTQKRYGICASIDNHTNV